ncbi:MAG: hypothetical protein Q7V63_02345 [Gammaproteobacteria bacterium]|nr:hypothetical protein [Gammaproteobacteria bacterium]
MDFNEAASRIESGEFSPSDIDLYKFDLHKSDPSYSGELSMLIEHTHKADPSHYFVVLLTHPTLLHIAILFRNMLAIKALLAEGANPSAYAVVSQSSSLVEAGGRLDFTVYPQEIWIISAFEYAQLCNLPAELLDLLQDRMLASNVSLREESTPGLPSIRAGLTSMASSLVVRDGKLTPACTATISAGTDEESLSDDFSSIDGGAVFTNLGSAVKGSSSLVFSTSVSTRESIHSAKSEVTDVPGARAGRLSFTRFSSSPDGDVNSTASIER